MKAKKTKAKFATQRALSISMSMGSSSRPASNAGYGNEANVSNDGSDDELPITFVRRHCQKRPKLVPSENQDLHTLPWISNALSHIQSADALITGHEDCKILHARLPYLRNLRSAAMTLFIHADDAILDAQTNHYNIQQQIHEEKLSALLMQLAHCKEQANKDTALLEETRKEFFKHSQTQSSFFLKQGTLFLKKAAALTSSYKSERDALIDQHACEQKALQRQLQEEREKFFCCVCHDKPRDTIILPCLHFQYCFSCLLQHREANSNTCPSCRGPIQGLSMSSHFAAQ